MRASPPVTFPHRSRDGLAAELCHDLDNVLLALSAHAASLRSSLDAPNPASVRCHLDAIESALDFLRHRSRRVRACSRRSPSSTSPVDLRDWWRGVEACVRAALPSRVRLSVDLPSTLPPVHIAADELTACVMHLVTNAGQAIPVDRADGETRIDGRVAGERAVQLRVLDNGVGMSPGSLRRAGEPGFTTRADGTGMGLHAVRCMIEQAGGSMKLSSRPGRGASIELLLPAATPASEGFH